MLFRKATMADIPALHKIINEYAHQGLMLRRPLMMLYESVRDFTVAVDERGEIAGAGGLHVMWEDLAEIRALVVRPDTKGQGVGKGIVDALVAEARQIGLKRVFALTYQQGFFEKCGFTVVNKHSLPQKVWKECVYCDKFQACDEIAMIRPLVPEAELVPDEEIPMIPMPHWMEG